ncbi:TPA: hypothetical protein MDE14_005097 [Klebsiella pneumoniae]|uniref:hypothetical protein n=1 Tax=Klebsiella pneumoniae TaxID=573 RepID=UPI0018A6153C|nr:hypothetical protein [Klebsiella pneumoniae]ELE4368170.1 hypothetical protein [Salmonella enterica]EIX9714719.1 hypothetical protein [Klebsiella pneumoniae]EMD7130179.1 hypothetical protein [Salmonella enterica]MDE8392896.1 hypothetical protein [Klebsiella pneumoniae]BBW89501.1 hypothetical protein THOKLE017_P30380 [Klebsiella pneumoniae]
MGNLTVKTDAAVDEVIQSVGESLGEKRASQTLIKSLMAYPGLRRENEKLRQELNQVQRELGELRRRVRDYKEARDALFGS